MLIYFHLNQCVRVRPEINTTSSVFSEPPKPMLSNSQILSIYPNYPVGGSPHAAQPLYPVTAMPWGQPQQGLLGNQWAGQPVASWPAGPAWGSAGHPIQAEGPQAGATSGGDTPTSPMAVNGFPSFPLNLTADLPEPEQTTSAPLL